MSQKPFKLPLDFVNSVDRSTHDLSLVKRTTIHPGVLYPIYHKKLMPGDRFAISIHSLLQSQPLVNQLFGTFKLRFAVFFDSDSNYYSWLDNNNKIANHEILNRVRHNISLNSVSQYSYNSGDYMNSFRVLADSSWDDIPAGNLSSRDYGVGNGSLADYLGIAPGFGLIGGAPGTPDLRMVLDPVLTYLNIFRNYYANNQESSFPWVRYSFENRSPFPTSSLSYLDRIPALLRLQTDGVTITSYSGNGGDIVTVSDSTYTNAWQWFIQQYLPSITRRGGGLLFDTFLPDMWNNFLFAGDTTTSVVNTSSGSFTIDILRFNNKLQKYIDRLTVSGGRFRNWLRTVWGVKTSKSMDIPELIGASQVIFDPSLVTATAQTGAPGVEGSTDLGQFGGNFNNHHNSDIISFRASTPGRIMIIMSLIPMVDYCQNIDHELFDWHFSDDYNPEFARLGFQQVPNYDYSALYPRESTGSVLSSNFSFLTQSNVKRIAWMNLMTDVNRVHGEFSNNGTMSYWVLQRRYLTIQGELESGVRKTFFNLTNYINPYDFQYPFVSQSIDDYNWMVQVALRIKAYRPIGKRFLGNL